MAIPCCQRLVEFASQSPPPKVYHVSYSNLIRDPVALAADIHRFYGIEMNQNHKDALLKFLSQNKQQSHGKHHHSKQNVGLTDDEMTEGLAVSDQQCTDIIAQYTAVS